MAHMFVTLIYGVLDVRTGRVTLCNASHNPPYVARQNGSVEAVNGARALALCLAGDFEYPDTALTLEPGDSLVLYTDGVTEAADKSGERFEDERLVACLEHVGQESPAEIIRDVLRRLEAFSGGVPQADDITLLALRYNGETQADARKK
ncbi:MAG: PP2C family protein-serine/threonine phosphatase [Rhodothermales bacterium]